MKANMTLILPRSRPARRPVDAVTATAERLAGWRDRLRQRRALRALDDHLLKDIGLSRADVERETMRPFWRV